MSIFIDPVAFWMIAARLSGMMLMIPAFSQIPAPNVFRVLVIVWLTLALMPTIPPAEATLATAWDLGIGAAGEILLGMGMGYVVRLIFATLEMGGMLIDTELSFRVAEQINPQSAITGGVMGRFFVAVGIFYFWVLDYFGLLILGLRESFFIVPAMGVGLLNEVSGWVRFSAGIFTGALVMAAPIIALSFAISVATGILARSVQGLNLFFEIFALRVVVGIGAVIFFLPLLLGMMRQQFETLIPMAGSVVRYFTGVGV